MCLGEGTQSAGMEAEAQKVAMGPDWRPPPGWDSRAGLLGGSRGFSQILEQTEGRLIWAISKRREAETIAEGPGSWNRGGRRSRPRIGKAGTPESEVDPGPREGRPPGLVALSRAPQPPPLAPRHEPSLPKNQAGVETAQRRGGQTELQ